MSSLPTDVNSTRHTYTTHYNIIKSNRDQTSDGTLFVNATDCCIILSSSQMFKYKKCVLERAYTLRCSRHAETTVYYKKLPAKLPVVTSALEKGPILWVPSPARDCAQFLRLAINTRPIGLRVVGRRFSTE